MRRSDDDFRREVEAHLAIETDRLIAEGVSPVEARRRAARAFGNVTRARERFYESRRILWLDELFQDVRYALRMYRRSPGFAAAVIVTLALGIGAVSAVFTLADHMLFRPLPYPDSDRLVLVSARGFLHGADYLRARELHNGFSHVAHTWLAGSARLPPSERSDALVHAVDSGFLEMLGVTAVRGRVFVEPEYQPESPVALITWQVFQSVFGGREDILEQEIAVYRDFDAGAGRGYRIVGVLPPSFVLPDHTNRAPAVLVPGVVDRSRAGDPDRILMPVARLAPGTSREAAAAELQTIVRSVEEAFPQIRQARQVVLTPLREWLFGRVRAPLVMLLVATGCVLLLACANLAHLFMSTLHARRRELGVRMAIGGNRWRLVRQLSVESGLLAVAGGAAALIVGRWTFDAVMAQAPVTAHVYRLLPAVIDGRIVMFATMLLCAAMIVSGLLPALSAARADIRESLVDSGVPTASLVARRRRKLLIGVQAGVAASLLVTSALIVHSFTRLASTPLGFDPRGLRTMTIGAPGTAEPLSTLELQRSIYEYLRGRVPGTVAMSDGIPAFTLPGLAGRVGGPPAVPVYRTSGTFFEVLDLELVRGRLFDEKESFGNVPVAVVDQSAAAQLWAGDEPIGKAVAADDGIARTVVGVVRALRTRLTVSEASGAVFLPIGSQPGSDVLLRRSIGAVDQARIEALARELLPGALVRTSDPLRVFERELGQPRFLAILLGALGGLTVILAAVGISGVVSHHVAGRRREMGIRLALGAPAYVLRRAVIRDALWPAAAGVVAGLVPTVWWTRTLRSLLYEIQPGDPLTLAAAILLVLALVFIASAVPARRATRVDPLLVLRSE